MDGAAIVTVAASVTALVQILKWSSVPTHGLIPVLLVFTLSALGCLLWAVSHEAGFAWSLVWDYFAGWIAVSTSAAGVFGLTRAVAAEVT